MKPIKVYSKQVNECSNGLKCTPFNVVTFFHGNVLINKRFKKRWFFISDSCLHILGFRFTKEIR